MALIEELKEITNGIYVLTVHQGEIRHGMCSSWRQSIGATSRTDWSVPRAASA